MGQRQPCAVVTRHEAWLATSETTALPGGLGAARELRVEVEKAELAGRARLGWPARAVEQQRAP